jgi:hypothetical protein
VTTTVDFDFMFRATPVNLAKLKRFARRLDAVILRPYYPVAARYRVMNDDRGLQVRRALAVAEIAERDRWRLTQTSSTYERICFYPLYLAWKNSLAVPVRLRIHDGPRAFRR